MRVPAFYPAFAEYSEPGTNDDPAVVDTGPVLRAFLPLGKQQPRFNIGDYKGVATVLDSRVSCVRPELENPQIQLDGMLLSGFHADPRFALTGTLSASNLARGVPMNSGLYETPYGCLVDPGIASDIAWRLTLCQIGLTNFGLLSQFKAMESYLDGGSSLSPAYLVLNVTTGLLQEWINLMNGSDFHQSPTYSQRVAAVRNESHGEWLDLVFTDNGTMRISASLCTTALDTADLFIHAFSDMNRTEPLAEFDTNNAKYRYDKVRSQLGQRNDGSWIHNRFKDRGILQLQPRPSWRAGTQQGDYIRPHNAGENWVPYISWVNNAARFESLNLVTNNDAMNSPFESNYSAYMSRESGGVFVDDSRTSGHEFSSIHPDPSFASLLQDILQHGGDIVYGLSLLLIV